MRLRQILFNLLGNAVKFTAKGFVRLSVQNGRNYDEGSFLDLIITVEDSGIGIPEGEQDRIFEAFEQQSGQHTRQFGGTGLGLAITRRLIELMHGTIGVESEQGRGSKFIVCLKRLEMAAVMEEREDDATAEADGEVEFESSTVLIVEDNPMNRSLIQEYLADSGLRTLEAENGEIALQLTREHRPDLILLDLNMPVMDGREAARRIRNEAEIADTPIVVLTASAPDEKENLTKNLNLQGYLLKPVARRRIIDELKLMLPHHVKGLTTATQADSTDLETGESLPEEIPTNFPALIDLLEGDLMAECQQASKRSRIGPIKKLSSKLNNLGQEYMAKPLIDYSHRLNLAIESFDVDQIAAILKEYPDMLESLKSYVQD